jgi:hypothetical protein
MFFSSFVFLLSVSFLRTSAICKIIIFAQFKRNRMLFIYNCLYFLERWNAFALREESLSYF